ncbi:MAG: hypothetical protein COU46_01840 [Candidatus Niyogibacteria bacterium CG10_big_fil_rev_8_21_14_0_10_42_19]|uniref:Small ribosomal subunit protein bS6 n=1 Tax=Candidatus Niyogibacteria bacterium CG10_big_fil_rev_8_21_14_0_10_42_19 TaxID=1974725 RepID=A0A2H0TFQ2_9BACT|nr:MAG: hypothetical protein COU46_01840 [Candidatus Niyogibacteria bacterium CG10_big_fil_rev_8_21_14_0_10_42_19]
MSSEKEPKLYEAAYFISGLLDEEKANETSRNLRELVENTKNIIVEESPLRRHKTAYPIKQQTEGFFGWLKFLMKPSGINDLSNKIKSLPGVIRASVIETKREEFVKRKIKTKKKVVTEEEIERIEKIDQKLEEILG